MPSPGGSSPPAGESPSPSPGPQGHPGPGPAAGASPGLGVHDLPPELMLMVLARLAEARRSAHVPRSREGPPFTAGGLGDVAACARASRRWAALATSPRTEDPRPVSWPAVAVTVAAPGPDVDFLTGAGEAFAGRRRIDTLHLTGPGVYGRLVPAGRPVPSPGGPGGPGGPGAALLASLSGQGDLDWAAGRPGEPGPPAGSGWLHIEALQVDFHPGFIRYPGARAPGAPRSLQDAQARQVGSPWPAAALVGLLRSVARPGPLALPSVCSLSRRTAAWPGAFPPAPGCTLVHLHLDCINFTELRALVRLCTPQAPAGAGRPGPDYRGAWCVAPSLRCLTVIACVVNLEAISDSRHTGPPPGLRPLLSRMDVRFLPVPRPRQGVFGFDGRALTALTLLGFAHLPGPGEDLAAAAAAARWPALTHLRLDWPTLPPPADGALADMCRAQSRATRQHFAERLLWARGILHRRALGRLPIEQPVPLADSASSPSDLLEGPPGPAAPRDDPAPMLPAGPPVARSPVSRTPYLPAPDHPARAMHFLDSPLAVAQCPCLRADLLQTRRSAGLPLSAQPPWPPGQWPDAGARPPGDGPPPPAAGCPPATAPDVSCWRPPLAVILPAAAATDVHLSWGPVDLVQPVPAPGRSAARFHLLDPDTESPVHGLGLRCAMEDVLGPAGGLASLTSQLQDWLPAAGSRRPGPSPSLEALLRPLVHLRSLDLNLPPPAPGSALARAGAGCPVCVPGAGARTRAARPMPHLRAFRGHCRWLDALAPGQACCLARQLNSLCLVPALGTAGDEPPVSGAGVRDLRALASPPGAPMLPAVDALHLTADSLDQVTELLFPRCQAGPGCAACTPASTRGDLLKVPLCPAVQAGWLATRQRLRRLSILVDRSITDGDLRSLLGCFLRRPLAPGQPDAPAPAPPALERLSILGSLDNDATEDTLALLGRFERLSCLRLNRLTGASNGTGFVGTLLRRAQGVPLQELCLDRPYGLNASRSVAGLRDTLMHFLSADFRREQKPHMRHIPTGAQVATVPASATSLEVLRLFFGEMPARGAQFGFLRGLPNLRVLHIRALELDVPGVKRHLDTEPAPEAGAARASKRRRATGTPDPPRPRGPPPPPTVVHRVEALPRSPAPLLRTPLARWLELLHTHATFEATPLDQQVVLTPGSWPASAVDQTLARIGSTGAPLPAEPTGWFTPDLIHCPSGPAFSGDP
ncbi:hypothetical protein H696_01833 [Fonticula alba]|uniref:F-box domain-containing protein n=1 Tax=Fonticula alba TaxID=691883 RepID=A0A058Z9U0_FONAL|nr:hypothetical protein H696_01833 [Fonticula alba]KCV70886.1 hypothetical protein H696_01833 [Fonticula alba]|eukprot:XP_009494009.1 hypothetical protein H696_01833 [Fonticula alba]